MDRFLCILISYLIGTINPSYILARIRGFDIRTDGSRNAGASNAYLTMGASVGMFCAIFDVFKAYAVVRLADSIFPSLPYAGLIAGVCCILGHIFPIWIGFRGGKGFACLSGVVLAQDPMVFLFLLLAEVVLVAITDYICVVPMTVSVAFPVIQIIQTGTVIGALIFLPATVAIIYRHLENLKRIRLGVEAHFSYLWRKNEEKERLQKNYDEHKSEI